MFPIGDDNPRRSTPYATIALIAVNVAVFLAVNVARPEQELQAFFLRWGFDAEHPFSVQVLTSMFLHGGIAHLLGNMWMLWIVGDNVEDKVGAPLHVLLYLLGGAAATWAYTAIALVTEQSPEVLAMLEGTGHAYPPLVGASGAIAAVMGIYLVFFPEARIRLLFWFFLLVQVIPVRAKWFLGLSLLLDLWRSIAAHGPAAGGVATMAHVGGGVFGIACALLLKRRVGGGAEGDAWDVHTGFASRPHDASAQPWEPPPRRGFLAPREPEESDLVELEAAITELVHSGRARQAIDLYPQYERMAREQPLPGDVQIELAHEFYRQGLPRDAVAAYRRYLSTEPAGEEADEARFRIGVLLARALGRGDEAAPYLAEAARSHPDPQIRAYAAQTLRSLR